MTIKHARLTEIGSSDKWVTDFSINEASNLVITSYDEKGIIINEVVLDFDEVMLVLNMLNALVGREN